MEKSEIIRELSEILLLDEGFNISKTRIEFDSISSLILTEYMEANFKIYITKDKIKEFNFIVDIINYIDENKS